MDDRLALVAALGASGCLPPRASRPSRWSLVACGPVLGSTRVTLVEQLLTIVETLDREGIEYALVGGLAVAVWGAPRATQDIDILVRPESVEAIAAAVESLGFRFRALPMTFSDGMSLQRMSRLDEGALLTLDLLLVNENLEPVWTSRQQLQLEDKPIWVISREALIQMKIAAGRTQDALDVQRLEELDR